MGPMPVSGRDPREVNKRVKNSVVDHPPIRNIVRNPSRERETLKRDHEFLTPAREMIEYSMAKRGGS